jgi:hypothetical protein
MNKFLHVTIIPADDRQIVDELSPVFDNAIDWLRYAPGCWIVLTNTDPDGWFARLKPHLKDRDAFFICEITLTNRRGMLTKKIWEWIHKYAGKRQMPQPKE